MLCGSCRPWLEVLLYNSQLRTESALESVSDCMHMTTLFPFNSGLMGSFHCQWFVLGMFIRSLGPFSSDATLLGTSTFLCHFRSDGVDQYLLLQLLRKLI